MTPENWMRNKTTMNCDFQWTNCEMLRISWRFHRKSRFLRYLFSVFFLKQNDVCTVIINFNFYSAIKKRVFKNIKWPLRSFSLPWDKRFATKDSPLYGLPKFLHFADKQVWLLAVFGLFFFQKDSFLKRNFTKQGKLVNDNTTGRFCNIRSPILRKLWLMLDF